MSTKKTASERILTFLGNNSSNSFTSKAVSNRTRVHPKTVRNVLPKLARSNLIIWR